MLSKSATPSDSRYVPFTQQASCCAPTCIQMVMYKEDIPLVPSEEIGYHLGLVVHPDKAYLFYDVRTSTTPPTSGYGTQIYEPEYEPNTAFKKLGIPLTYSLQPIQEILTVDALTDILKEVEAANANALLCFNHGSLVDDPNRDWGHLVLFDRIVDSRLRIIDPSPDYPKWRLVDPVRMFNAMKIHGQKKTASGVWHLKKN